MGLPPMGDRPPDAPLDPPVCRHCTGTPCPSAASCTVFRRARADVGEVRQPGGMMHVCALSVELHLDASASLKAKRAIVKHLVGTARSRYGVAAAEVGFHEQWQHSELGFAAVAESPGHVEEVLDAVERFVWSHPEVVVIATSRAWVELEG